MLRDKYPPESSAITMTESSEGIRYTWSAGGKRSLLNLGVTAFLAVWLVGWAIGEISAIGSLMDGDTPGRVSLFMLVWLGGWTLGGIWCVIMIYLNVRPLRPSELRLGLGEITFETGTRRPDMTSGDRRNANITAFFKGTRNRVYRIPARDISNLQLERVGERLRLSIDHGSERIEIGETLGEPDKEWLHGVIRGVAQER